MSTVHGNASRKPTVGARHRHNNTRESSRSMALHFPKEANLIVLENLPAQSWIGSCAQPIKANSPICPFRARLTGSFAIMSSNDSGSASPTSTVITRESRKRALEEKQKNFELEKRKRRTKVNLENQADALALETESLQYQEEDLSQYQQDCAHKERKLADSVTAMEHMEQILNTEREKLVELQKTFDEQKERLDWEKQQFSAEKEVIGSLERDFASKQEKLAADEKKLALARERFEDGDDLISVDGSDSEFGCSKRRKNHNLEAESLEENVNCLPGTPTSSHFHAVHSDASEGTNVDNHAFVRDGYGYHLGSPSGEAISAVLSEIRAKRREQNDDTPESVPSEHKSIVVSGKTVEDHRLAILEKAKRVDKPIEDVS